MVRVSSYRCLGKFFCTRGFFPDVEALRCSDGGLGVILAEQRKTVRGVTKRYGHFPKWWDPNMGLGKNLLVRIYRRAVLFAASLVKR